ncbi:MAG: histone deacetylase family protein [Pseudomonadota bacterium]
MRCFYDPATAGHAPQFFMVRGRPVANEERAERAERLLAALKTLGLPTEAPSPVSAAALTAVHTPRYLNFLETAHAAWQSLPGAGPEVLPNVVPRRPETRYPAGLVGKAGFHMGDLACPIGPATFSAAIAAASTAASAANAVIEGAPAAYALTRPPGHHAHAEMAAGHCFLNNAAIAAAALTKAGARVAILDMDVHHGNGTQAIFYERPDILTVSIHTHPDGFYPWFVGHHDEMGAGPGEGFNLNLPLPMGADDAAWHAALGRGIDAVHAFGADTLVLSLGLDVHASDPLAGMTVTTDGLRAAGALIGAVPLPTAIVQEGGYLSPELTTNAAAFLSAFLSARPL